MQPEYQPWFIVSKSRHMTARFGAEQGPDGQTLVSVRLQQLVKDVPRQDFDCPLSVLKQVVELGKSAKNSFDYKETIRLKEPDKFVELEGHTVKFYGRLKPSGEEQVAILIESKEEPEQGKEHARFLGDLDHLKEFAEAGHEYEELAGQSQTWRPLVQIVEPGPTRDRAMAQVVGLATDQEHGPFPKRMSIEKGQKKADEDRTVILWPHAMSYVPVGRLIEVQRFDDVKQNNLIKFAESTKINNVIEFVHADRERRGVEMSA